MSRDERDAVIVASTVDLGRRLGLRVVAEGVETAEAYARLVAMGCDVAQGYYLSPPVPPGRLEAWTKRFEPAERVRRAAAPLATTAAAAGKPAAR